MFILSDGIVTVQNLLLHFFPRQARLQLFFPFFRAKVCQSKFPEIFLISHVDHSLLWPKDLAQVAQRP